MDYVFTRSERNTYSNEKLSKVLVSQLQSTKMSMKLREKKAKEKQNTMRKEKSMYKILFGYVAIAMRHFYSDMKNAQSDGPRFEKAVELASRS